MINLERHTRAVVTPVCRTPSDMHACMQGHKESTNGQAHARSCNCDSPLGLDRVAIGHSVTLGLTGVLSDGEVLEI